jgi:hypothetical protein
VYARWLIGLEAITLGILLYFAEISGRLRYQGTIVGLDEAYDTDSYLHYFIWRLRAREALLFVVVVWVAAVLLAACVRIRGRSGELASAKYGSRGAIIAALVLPIAVLIVGFIFGLDSGM